MTEPTPNTSETDAKTRATPRGTPLLFVALIAAVAYATFVFWPRAEATGPVAHFRLGPDAATVRPFDEVPTFDPMRLTLELPDAAFVYVVSFDYRRGTVCYYPTEFLGTDHSTGKEEMHAFAAGTWELPGTWDGKTQSWFVPDTDGAFSFCVLASARRIDDLDAVLPLCRQVGNRAFQSRSMGHYMPRAGRDKVVGQKKMPHPVLEAALHQPDALLPGPMVELNGHPGVYAKTFNIRPGKPRPGVSPPANPLQGQLQKMAKDQLNVPAAPSKK